LGDFTSSELELDDAPRRGDGAHLDAHPVSLIAFRAVDRAWSSLAVAMLDARSVGVDSTSRYGSISCSLICFQ